MNPRVFREYDIRGNADRDLDDGFANDLGKAIGTYLKRAGARKITVGRDCRVTSPRLHKALRSGILATGVHVIDVGIVATDDAVLVMPKSKAQQVRDVVKALETTNRKQFL